MKKVGLLILLTSAPAFAQEPTWGFAKDENGRPYQTHFDLRKRWMWGGGGSWTPDLSGYLETRAEVEEYEEWDAHRDRHEFLAGRLDLRTMDYSGTLYLWERSRYSDVPSVWLTTFIGEPRRFDIPIHLGPLFGVGLVEHRGDLTWVDVARTGFHWSGWQSDRLDDFVRLQFVVSTGVLLNEVAAPLGTVSPEGTLQWRWSPGARGLWEMSGQVGVRYDYAPAGTSDWRGKAVVELERVLIAVNDQPITLVLGAKGHTDGEQHDWAADAGLRVSFFSPPPPPPDQCPGAWEDFDGFQDEDGCPDPDNDADGVLDTQDYCPMDPGSPEHSGCPAVIPAPPPQPQTIPEPCEGTECPDAP